MPILRCLFCNHVNPAEASFCNACGSQLDLQPCGQCGAVDSRTAKSCHKCGTPFAPALASALDALLAPMPTVPHGDAWDHSSRIEASVAGAKAIMPTYGQPRTKDDRQLTVGEVATQRQVQPAKSGSGWLVPGVALLGVVLAATFAIFYQRPVVTTPVQAAQPVATRVVEAPAAPAPPIASTTPVPTVQADAAAAAVASAAVVPAQTLPVAPAVRAAEPAKVPARAVPRTVATKVVPPLPVTQAPPTARREPPAVKDCSQALATLGLCTP